MTAFVHPGTNANHFLDAALGSELSPDFAEILSLYGVQHLMSETSECELTDLSSDLPTDTHLVTFRTAEGAVSCDAARAHSRCDIFDAYADSGLTVIGISSGFGVIKPILFNNESKGSK